MVGSAARLGGEPPHSLVPPHPDTPSSTAGVEYSWDLSTLCQPNGEYYVSVNDPAAGQYIAFNVAGNTSSMCSFDPATPLYDSRGSAIQFVEGWNNGNPGISPATLAGKACPKQTNCTDWDNAPATTDGGLGWCVRRERAVAACARLQAAPPLCLTPHALCPASGRPTPCAAAAPTRARWWARTTCSSASSTPTTPSAPTAPSSCASRPWAACALSDGGDGRGPRGHFWAGAGTYRCLPCRAPAPSCSADDAWGCPYDPGRQNKLVFERNFVVILTCDVNAPLNSIANLAVSSSERAGRAGGQRVASQALLVDLSSTSSGPCLSPSPLPCRRPRAPRARTS